MDITSQVMIDLTNVTDKLTDENIRRGMYYMLDSQALPDMNNYVPLKGGELRMSGNIEGFDTLAWNTPYAHAQYTGNVGKPSGVWYSDKQRRWYFWALHNGMLEQGYTTPGTGPKWDEVAKANHMDAWLNAFMIGAGLN